jgi:hypothetical protein
MASTAGIVPGMSAAGAYLPANAQVISVAGNTVTLDSPADPAQFFTAIAAAAGNLSGNRLSVEFSASLSGLFTVGSLIASDVLPVTARAQILGFRDMRLAFGKNVFRYRVADINIAASNTGSYLWTVYNETAPVAATYTFNATSRNYTFKADAVIPYGSFPGIGTFFT